jgi:hypothetical protein
VKKETILTLRRIRWGKKQRGCKEGITSVIIKGERTGNLLLKSPRAVPSHHPGRYRPKSMQSAGR